MARSVNKSRRFFMILLLDTSTPTCHLTLVDGEKRFDEEWLAERQLAHGLLSFIDKQLNQHGYSLSDLTGIGTFRGPGSFTGLRIGLTVLNTLADGKQIPIVGTDGEEWQSTALRRLMSGENDQIVLPLYGSEAHITKQRK
ncbi:MAG: HAD-superfamily hydrolase, subfamily variant 3 [Candidatus Saccharibacteria bacterium]|nr:HAD-superfamily hydrolase, subfamily variant 3 [Candidatus Saccharibacteria bacterium]